MNQRKVRPESLSAATDFLSLGQVFFRHQEKQKALPMTICAAAICQHVHKGRDGKLGPSIVTVSDRMLSSADIEYEPALVKVKKLAPSIVCLYSGERDYHHMIADATHRTIIADNVTNVADVADIYAFNFLALRKKRSEAKYLSPVELTYESFVARIYENSSDFVSNLFMKILNEKLGVQAIVAGTDHDEAHIYTVGADEAEGVLPICHDERGFVAIGTGSRQFETEFMAQGYTRRSGSLFAMWMMIAAKLKSERSPGVGSATDLTIITEKVGYWLPKDVAEMAQGIKELSEFTDKKRDEIIERLAATPQPSLDKTT
jgi:hypothetical protein